MSVQQSPAPYADSGLSEGQEGDNGVTLVEPHKGGDDLEESVLDLGVPRVELGTQHSESTFDNDAIMEKSLNDKSEGDPRVNFQDPNFRISAVKLLLFLLLKFILPFTDFITDLQMVLTFAAPAIGGYEICTKMSDSVYSGVNATNFGSVPQWTLNGHLCGYVDGRYVPPVEAARRRKRRLSEENVSVGVKDNKAEGIAGRGKVAKKAKKKKRNLKRRHTAESDDAARITASDNQTLREGVSIAATVVPSEQTDDCAALAAADESACWALDKCRWDVVPGGAAYECFDPVLKSLEETSEAIDEDTLQRMYCSQFQPMHRGEASGSANATRAICLRNLLSDAQTYACEWDPYWDMCAPAKAFWWTGDFDQCSRVAPPGTYNQGVNDTCSALCNCVYTESGTNFYCLDRMAFEHLKSPYSRDIEWTVGSNYCHHAKTSTCCDYSFGDTQLCCSPDGASCQYSPTSDVCSADTDIAGDIHAEYFTPYASCTLEESCYHTELNGMFSEEALRNRYCDQCTRCGMELLPTQVIVELQSGSLEGVAKAEMEIEAWSNKFSCCACPVIQGGRTCALSDDVSITDINAENDELETCDKIGQVPLASLADHSANSYALKTMNSYFTSDNCQGNPLISPEDECKGWATSFSNFEEDKFEYFGKTCTRSENHEKVYTTFDEPQTCKTRYLGYPEAYMEKSYDLRSCHAVSDFADNGCMTVEEMKMYFQEYDSNQWYDDTYDNWYTYKSCLYPDGGHSPNDQHYRDCCYRLYRENVESDTCSDYVEGSCPCGCIDFDVWGAKENPFPGYCYDPVNATIASELETRDTDPGYEIHKEFNVQYYCYFMTTQSCCEAFTDFTSSESTEPSLCEWYSSNAGIGPTYDPTSSAKCQPKTNVHAEGYCLETSDDCACVDIHENYFKPPFSNDLQCPHNGNCHLQAEDECALFSHGGFLSSWVVPHKIVLEEWFWKWPSKYTLGSTSCHLVGGDKKMHFSSVDTYVTGTGECEGFSASFGCYSGTDAVTIGEALVSPLGLNMGCMGTAEDECRQCNLWHVFDLLDATVFPQGQWFNYGDASLERNFREKTLSISASIALLLLFAIVLLKEAIGLYIVLFMIWEFKTQKGAYFDRDHDAITVGKDSIAALLYLLCLCVKIWYEEGLTGIALYQARFKLLEDGWTTEELVAKWEAEHEEAEMEYSLSLRKSRKALKIPEDVLVEDRRLEEAESAPVDVKGYADKSSGDAVARGTNDGTSQELDTKDIDGGEDEEFQEDFFIFHSPPSDGGFQAELLRLYEAHCPEKANRKAIEETLASYKGRELELLSAAGEKYRLTVRLDDITICTRISGKAGNVFRRKSNKKRARRTEGATLWQASVKKVTALRGGAAVSDVSDRYVGGSVPRKRTSLHRRSLNTSIKAQEGDVGLESLIEKAVGIGDTDDGGEDIVMQPLIDPETRFYELWNWLEVLEALIGVGLGLLIFVQLAFVDFIRGGETLPPSDEIGVAMVSFFASLGDLIFNIFSKFWTTHGRMKYVKYFLNSAVFCVTAAIVINIYFTLYNNPACVD